MEIESIRKGDGTRLARGLGWFGMGLGAAEIAVPRTVARWIGAGDRGRTSAIVRALGAREMANSLGILARPRSPLGLWARVAGDAIDLALLGLVLRRRRTRTERVAVAIGGVLAVAALDVVTGRRLQRRVVARPATATITIHRSPEEIYAFYCDVENLPRFMELVDRVEMVDDHHAHWVVRLPLGRTLEWDTELVEDVPNQRLSWRSSGRHDLAHRMTVMFRPAPGGRGTEVTAQVELAGPAHGTLGKLLARQQLEGDLRRLKQVLETGEIMRSDATLHRGLHPGRPEAIAPGGVP